MLFSKYMAACSLRCSSSVRICTFSFPCVCIALFRLCSQKLLLSDHPGRKVFKSSRNPYYSGSFRFYHRLSSRVYKIFPSFVYFSVSTGWKFWDSQVCQLPCFFPQLLLNYCWYHAGPCNFYQFIHWRIPCQLDFCMIFVCFGFGISLLCLGWGGLRRFKSSAVTATEFQDIYTCVCYWYSKKKIDTYVYMVCFSWK